MTSVMTVWRAFAVHVSLSSQGYRTIGLRSRAVRTFGAALREGTGRPATASGLYGRPLANFRVRRVRARSSVG